MRQTSNRLALFAGTSAILLAAAPALAEEQSTTQTQTSSQGQQASDVGREQAAVPEWQYYDQRDPRYGPLAWLTFAEVIGADVASQEGQMIGQVTALVRDKPDNMFHAVVDSIDAVAGPDQYVAVPVDRFEVVGNEQSKQLVLAGNRQLQDMPPYEESRYEKAELSKSDQAQQ